MQVEVIDTRGAPSAFTLIDPPPGVVVDQATGQLFWGSVGERGAFDFALLQESSVVYDELGDKPAPTRFVQKLRVDVQ